MRALLIFLFILIALLIFGVGFMTGRGIEDKDNGDIWMRNNSATEWKRLQ